MATATAFSSLTVPPDDTMEMSSPANRDIDDDIDIDFDDYRGGVQIPDDDQMLEDVDATRPTTATDDLMEDDAPDDGQVQYGEEEMQDDEGIVPIQQQEDEELIDYGEEELHDEAADDFLEANVFDNSADAENELEHVDEEIAREPEVAVAELPADEVVLALAEEHMEAPEQAVEGQGYTEDALDDIDDTLQAEQEQPVDITDQAPTQVCAPINTPLGVQTDTPGTPTDTGLHPMSIRYGDVQMPLFRSKRQLDGLLKDDNLASLSLAELIKNCRQRLAIKIGEDVSEDQELVLGFDGMGLILVEVRQDEVQHQRRSC